MVAAQNNAYAPAIRLDADDRQDDAIIDARNIAVTFRVEHGTVEAVKDISFQLYRGETIAIVGESGSGKSVTARTVMGLLTKRASVSKSATVRFNGDDILKLRAASGERSWQPHLDDLSGADEFIEPDLYDR